MLRSALVVILGLAAVAHAGDLNPPPGPVSPTMKPLDTIEPRRCLNDLPPDEGAVVLVTEAGQYFMRADIVAGAGQHGVRIVASGDVSIDLNGFSIRGVAGSVNGIDMALPQQGPPSSLHVRCGDGSCRSSISGFGGDGVFTSHVLDVRCESFDSSGHGGRGLHHLHAQNVVHRDIAARNCGGDGMRSASGLATGKRRHKAFTCVSTGNGGDGISIEPTTGDFEVVLDDVSCSENGVNGLHVVEPAAAGGSETLVVKMGRMEMGLNGGSGVLIELQRDSSLAISMDSSSCYGNTGDGFTVRSLGAGPHFGAAVAISSSRFMSNGGHGVSMDNPMYATNSTCADNALYGATCSTGDATTLAMHLDRCEVRANGSGGARTVRGRFACVSSQISDNLGHGMEVNDGCLLVTDSSSTANTGDGANVVGTLNVDSSTFRRNGGNGVSCSSGSCVAEGMVCELNGALGAGGSGAVFDGCPTVTLRRCVFNENDGDGVRCSSPIGPVRWMAPESLASRNGGDGFDLNDCVGASLDRCVSTGNGGTGFRLGASFNSGRVERCHSSGNTSGEFSVSGAGNLILRCRATFNAVGAYDVAPGNVLAPVVDPTGLPANRNPDANLVY
jgi:hypothetical protein